MDHSDAGLTAISRQFVNLGERQAVCPSHGAFTATGRVLGGREVWTTCQDCHKEQLRAEIDDRARRQAEINAKEREAAIGQACIPARFRSLTFESFVPETPAQLETLTRVRDYAEGFAEHKGRGTGLVLAGKPGTGKTHLAAAAMLTLLDAGVWVQYTACMGLIRMVRETWGKDSERTERSVIRLLGEQIDLLVIDEVGVQYGTESEQHILFEVLDRRYAEMRPTILITNQDKVNFKALIGERISDRLTQTHDWIAFNWASYRREARGASQ